MAWWSHGKTTVGGAAKATRTWAAQAEAGLRSRVCAPHRVGLCPKAENPIPDTPQTVSWGWGVTRPPGQHSRVAAGPSGHPGG